MEKIEFSVVIFCDNSDNVIVQKRGSKSRNNEKYALWGGKVEAGETGEEAIKREVFEELGFIPEILNKGGDYQFKIKEGIYKGKVIVFHVFLSPITEGLIDVQVKEGEKMVLFKAADIVDNEDFFQGDRDLLNKLINEGKLLIK